MKKSRNEQQQQQQWPLQGKLKLKLREDDNNSQYGKTNEKQSNIHKYEIYIFKETFEKRKCATQTRFSKRNKHEKPIVICRRNSSEFETKQKTHTQRQRQQPHFISSRHLEITSTPAKQKVTQNNCN